MIRLAKRVAISLCLLALLGGASYYVYQEARAESECSICLRPIHHRTGYRLHLSGGRVEAVCCARCGLRFQQHRDDVDYVEVADFNTAEALDATEAFFVENSTNAFCCRERMGTDRAGIQYRLSWDRCLPGLVAFKTRDAAETFRQRIGGEIKTYRELLEEQL